MQSLVRLPEIAAVMRDMSKEMMKAGIIEEMVDDTMSSLEDEEEMEEEAQTEIDKVVFFLIKIISVFHVMHFNIYNLELLDNLLLWCHQIIVLDPI